MILTWIESVEAELEKCKEWIIKEHGDHMSIHNAFAELREGLLRAGSTQEAPVEAGKMGVGEETNTPAQS